MKNIFKVLLCLLFLTSLKTYAQTCDLQFVVILNNGTNYDVKVQIQGSSSFKLGTSNITFNYNSDDLGDPSLLEAHNFSGGSYSTLTVTKPLTGVTSINIVFNGSSGNGTTVNTGWTDVATVRFPTLDQNGNSSLSFRTSTPNKTGVFVDNNSTEVTQGTWSSLNTNPLPVELSSFSASAKQNIVNLQWQTKTEVNNYGFEVERRSRKSEDRSQYNSQWIKVGFVDGNGNSNSPKDYSFMDKNLTGGSKFAYRLKQVDNDGTFTYSDEVEVAVVPDKYELYQNYPNPFNPVTNIKFSLPEATKVRIDIFNIIGEKVKTLIEQNMEAGFHVVPFDAENLTSGTYIYRLQTENFTQIKKMLLLK
ncbi:MAG: hypothetical protein A2057_05600 [Ignavibacteria bacterium GWA2_35_9]|nr:MAG: hypothetical protein A2057_05600 [Ignavibacteria bacterium GWA2_35_9]OGU52267.1 MAG: hypothetical protein A2080_08375 [Ignavibacteria bacterium GWC2_36_12]